MNGQDLREAISSSSPQAVANILVEELDAERLTPEDFSIRELWEAFVGPVNQTIGLARSLARGGFIEGTAIVEAVQSTALTFVTGNVIINKVQQAYDAQPGILGELTTPMSSRMRSERVVGWQAYGGIADVAEGEEYPHTGMKDRATEAPEPMKRGMQIAVTEETVVFDQTGQVLTKAANIGATMRMDEERFGIRRIQDLAGYKSFYPIIGTTPTQTDLYRTAAVGTEWYNKTINALTGNALTDWTSVDAVLKLMADVTDEAGDNIIIVPRVVLAPRAIWATLLMIIGATENRKDSQSAVYTSVSPNVLQLMGGALIPMWSPFMNNTTDWYVGDPKAQFVNREIFPLQVVSLPPKPERDILAGYRVRRKSQVEALDDKYFYRSAP